MHDGESAPLLERLGLRRRHGVGEAGWGWTLLAAVVSLIYFAPVLWIILTALVARSAALMKPPVMAWINRVSGLVLIGFAGYGLTIMA